MGETRGTRRFGALATALTLALLLPSCTTPSPHPAASPVQATSTQSAQLVAAIDAFTAFNAVLDGYAGGTTTVDGFTSLVTPDYFQTLVVEDKERDSSTRTVGASSFGDEKLVNPDEWGGFGDVALVVCLDTSRTDVVDASGRTIPSPQRRTLIPMIIFFENEPDEPTLLVSKVEQWNEDGYCS